MSEPAEESGAQLLARLVSERRPQINNLDSKLFPYNGPFPKEIAEISGETGLGKSTLLMHIITKVILPLEYGGKNGKVFLLLTDHNFDFDKFSCIVEKSIAECTTSNESETDILTTTLHNNITIQRCFDELQFELAICQLDKVLSESDRYCLLALDSIGAFYYTSKASESGPTYYTKELLKKLQRIINDYHLALVYTKPAYFVQKATSNRMEGVNYILELIEAEGSLVYKVEIAMKSPILRKYGFDCYGCIEWKE